MLHLDVGMTLEEGSQYFVAPVIQEFISAHLSKRYPEMLAYLKEHQEYAMNI